MEKRRRPPTMKKLITMQQRFFIMLVVILVAEYGSVVITTAYTTLSILPYSNAGRSTQFSARSSYYWDGRTTITARSSSILSLSSTNNDASDEKDLTKSDIKSTPGFSSSSTTNNIDITTLQSTTTLLGGSSTASEEENVTPVALTGTVNERLMAELESARLKEQFGARSGSSPRAKKQRRFGLDQYRTDRKSEEERLAAIEEAKNLNGINPVVALGGAAVAFGCAALLWTLTDFLAGYFAVRPVENISDIYFIQRVTAVFRNVVMGLVSLASGFFGVTGFGIFLLSIRVAYGVITGELDPTPIESKSATTKEELPNVWDLMLNKKPGRTRR
jgi:hypothetical protein